MKYIDLFSGAGGLSLGLERAGLKPLLGVELDKYAAQTYSSNFGHPCLNADISKVSGNELIELAGDTPDLLAGGPPCQGFSTVGKRNRADERNHLVWEFIRIASEIKPKIVMIENVLGLKDMNFVEEIEKALFEIGYKTTHHVFTSADYGVPQLRRRVVFIGSREGFIFNKPKPIVMKHNYISVEDAIGDLPELMPSEEAKQYNCEPKTDYQRLMRGDCDVLVGHKASKHDDKLVKAISFIPDGGSRKSIPDEFQPTSGFHNSYSRLNSKEPAVAITQNMSKPSGTRCIHPKQNRGLTPREGARLQSFPDSFEFKGTGTAIRLQIANAVPPLLAESIGKALLDPSSWTRVVTIEEFSEQLSLAIS
ncbi:DNA cytosine methyltransferase [Vibrio diabolicus]|uniref:DNA cytosine methyltransferase n=1 Tax=Vibrio diabolicus TaxID=50719 RepID=UPI00211AB1BB|nr:DNA cytosine methyltransferase [Vibrio parahaemolyticus]MCG6280781.1 DNA cytosine methyltransferase [Vibrio diabolicus]